MLATAWVYEMRDGAQEGGGQAEGNSAEGLGAAHDGRG